MHRRLDNSFSAVQLDLRVACATRYKEEGYEHNRKQERLVASAVIASQQIPASSVTLAADPAQPVLVASKHSSTTHYLCC